MLVVCSCPAHQLGGGVLADQPHAAFLLGAVPVGHLVQLPVQAIQEAMGVHSLLAALGSGKNIHNAHLCRELM